MKVKTLNILLFIAAIIFSACSFFNTLSKEQFNSEIEKYTLKDLKISKVSYMSSSFSPTTYNYEAIGNLSLEYVTIKATAYNNDISIIINGQKAESGIESNPIYLSSNESSIKVDIINSKIDYKKKYTIKVYKLFEDTICWNKKFSKTSSVFYNSIYSLAIDSNNNIYAISTEYNLYSNNSNKDWWIKKFNANGSEYSSKWDKKIHSSYHNNDEIKDIAIDSGNNVYAAGTTYNSVNSSSYYDWWIKKFDADGNEYKSWNKSYSNSNSTGYESVYSLAIDSHDNVYVAGIGYNLISTSSEYDCWIKKFDSAGNEDIINWDKKINYSIYNTKKLFPLAIDSNDNLLIAAGSNNDYKLLKYNSSGIIVWFKNLDSNVPYSIAIDLNDNIYATGTGHDLYSYASSNDWWIKKFDTDGNEILTNWNKKFSNSDYDYYLESAFTIAIDSNNYVYVAGTGYNLVSSVSCNDWWIKKFDANGNEDTSEWNLKFSSSDSSFEECAFSIAADSNNNIYLTGCGYNMVSTQSCEDWWIKKFLAQ